MHIVKLLRLGRLDHGPLGSIKEGKPIGKLAQSQGWPAPPLLSPPALLAWAPSDLMSISLGPLTVMVSKYLGFSRQPFSCKGQLRTRLHFSSWWLCVFLAWSPLAENPKGLCHPPCWGMWWRFTSCECAPVYFAGTDDLSTRPHPGPDSAESLFRRYFSNPDTGFSATELRQVALHMQKNEMTLFDIIHKN